MLPATRVITRMSERPPTLSATYTGDIVATALHLRSSHAETGGNADRSVMSGVLIG
jgi:hypothetical protein